LTDVRKEESMTRSSNLFRTKAINQGKLGERREGLS
jgi:hypothetical protein